jgi:hypothetical protein
MIDNQQAKFEGWAMIEMMGHQRETGFVTTEYYGAAALFRVDVPELPEREYAIERPEYTPQGLLPIGTVVKRGALPARTRLIAPGAVYAINPCSEEVARRAVDSAQPRPLILVKLPEGKQIESAPVFEVRDREFECCGGTPSEGHEQGCAYA